MSSRQDIISVCLSVTHLVQWAVGVGEVKGRQAVGLTQEVVEMLNVKHNTTHTVTKEKEKMTTWGRDDPSGEYIRGLMCYWLRNALYVCIPLQQCVCILYIPIHILYTFSFMFSLLFSYCWGSTIPFLALIHNVPSFLISHIFTVQKCHTIPLKQSYFPSLQHFGQRMILTSVSWFVVQLLIQYITVMGVIVSVRLDADLWPHSGGFDSQPRLCALNRCRVSRVDAPLQCDMLTDL